MTKSTIEIFCKDSIEHSRNDLKAFVKTAEIHAQVFQNSDLNDSSQVMELIRMIILSFDIFDDVQDKDNSQAPWSKDERQAINLGLYLLISAYEQMNKCSFADLSLAYEYLTLNLTESVKGQYADIRNDISTEKEYLEMCKAKSGSLVSLASVLGALTVTTDHLPVIHSYSLDIGIAAQISNDIKDLVHFEQKNDVLLKKKTLPILYLFEEKQASLIEDYFLGALDYSALQKNKTEVIRVLYKSGALNYAREVKNAHLKRARGKVNALPIDRIQKDTIIENIINII